MPIVNITLKDRSVVSVEQGTPIDKALADRLRGKSAVAAKSKTSMFDLNSPVLHDIDLELIDISSKEGLDILRHSTSHIMALAVRQLYPDVKVAIGPAIEDGFYYDFDREEGFSPDDIKQIEKKMKEIIRADTQFERITLPRQEALELFSKAGEIYKSEIIQEIKDENVSLYRVSEFTDLCRGPHIPSTGFIKAFKITATAGAYWRGDERNKMLHRIYGTVFSDKDSLKQHLERIEEAKKRDHRKLGKELDLFNIYDEAGSGLIVYHPKGALLRRILEDFEIKQHLKKGYKLVKGPQILKSELWQKSGHLDNYKDNMYFTEVEGRQYGLKPMNCIAHMLIYNSRIRSYKELPLRYFELGTVNRHERSGVLHGLTRVREFTQDDAHILCTPEQLNGEICAIIDFVREVMDVFSFEFEVELSTRPEKSIGTDSDWERAVTALSTALDDKAIKYEINEGDGAFYGPKIDFKIKDSLKRSWQCATIQCDFSLPERFDLNYIGDDGSKHRPVMLHRVILGSIERFLGVLIEHYAGAFPTWLAPVQAVILTISDHENEYCINVKNEMAEKGIRVELDTRNESLGFKIREGQIQKIPYMIIIGKKEIETNTLSLRMRNGKNINSLQTGGIIEIIHKDCKDVLKEMYFTF